MFLRRDERGRFQQVRKPKDKEKFGRLKPTRTILDPPIWIDPGDSPLPLNKDSFDPGKGKVHEPPKNTRLPDRSRGPPPNRTRLPNRSRGPPIANTRIHILDTASAADRYLSHEDPEVYPHDEVLETPPPAPDPPRGTRRRGNLPAPDPPHGVQQTRNPPSPDAGDHPPDREPRLPQPARSPPRRPRRPARHPVPDPDQVEEPPPPALEPPWGSRRAANSASNSSRRAQRPTRLPDPETAAYGGPPQRFNIKRVIVRDPEVLFAEASQEISLDTGTPYPCTQKDLDTCGGVSRRASRKIDHAQLRAMWLPQPNRGPSVSIKTAAREVFEHNSPAKTGRRIITSGKEREAIHRLLAMMEKACRDSWGPDLAIKAFCDLDTVFFGGKLRGHVCVTWADVGEFPDRNVFGHTVFLGMGKAMIQLNALFVFFDWGYEDGRLFTQMLATVLHEMVHAYQFINCREDGKDGWVAANAGRSGGHDKNYGTMMLAVNTRAFDMLGLKGDPTRYPCHEYAKREDFP